MMNGIRQPQSLKASLPSHVRVPMMTPSETTMPRVGEVWSHPV
jgi:hypothetical protein